MAERQGTAWGNALSGGLGVAAGSLVGGLGAGTVRALPGIASALGKGDFVGADRAIQAGISRQQGLNQQFRRDHPIAAAALDAARGHAAPLVDALGAAAARSGATQVRRRIDIERVGKRPDGGGAIISEKMPYQPQRFVGAEGLAALGRPPGYDQLPAGQEYGIEIPKYEIVNGDLQGTATAYWQGGERNVSLEGASAAHGGHPNNVGLSEQDRRRFDRDLNDDPGAISTVWSTPGVMAVAMPEATLQKLTRYNPKLAGYATVEGQPLALSGGRVSDWTPEHTTRQLFFAPDNRQISEAEARALMAQQQTGPRGPLYSPNKK